MSPPSALSAEEMLARAMKAKTPRARGEWAKRGLAVRAPLDKTTQAMLLRQLYLAHFEEGRFAEARAIAEQCISLSVLPDVAHQDAARAALALGDTDSAAGHLRLAARVSPAARRAFHWWTLGSLYFVAKRYRDAKGAMERAARWGTTDKPLYLAHLALIRCAAGEPVPDLATLFSELEAAPSGQGYGRFVLGHLAHSMGRYEEARRHLEAFVTRSTAGRAALTTALSGEIALSRETLAKLGKLGNDGS